MLPRAAHDSGSAEDCAGGQNKAIQAILRAKVKQEQVAKHFGVPLAAMRWAATKPPPECFPLIRSAWNELE